MKELLSRCRAAVDRYGMIPGGARVAVGISGGKDSLCALLALARLREFYPNSFELTALTADPCFGGSETDYSSVTEWCESLGVPHIVRRTRLWEIVFEERKEKNPCALCSKMRRGVLHRMANEAGCDTVALGHHSDDAAETVLMNLLRGGRVAGLPPKSFLDRSGLTVIRPLYFCDERLCERIARRESLPVVESGCPVDGYTERQRVRDLIEQLAAGDYPDIKTKLIHAGEQSGAE